MNVYELDTLSIQYIRRPVDNDARTELSAFFLTAYNEIYRRIMSEVYRITCSEEITLSPNGSFDMIALSRSLLSIKSIKSDTSEKLKWEKGSNGKIIVHTQAKHVTVTYFYMPPLLQNSEPTSPPSINGSFNNPIIPSEYHNIFALWAAYRYLHSRRKFEDANYYYEMAMELFYKISCDIGEKTKFNINYLS